ncbi:MAG: acyl CoA:acetate/3-ketoacid CoA transferase [Firmicutes bacterium]|jgi:propionate CoA-transferase|nr:acyl CoA:acetate/3-ketoacid CoA transferase [Bacillota bacterium]MDH7496794.1 CoA-transferase [Bacillota bacterium]
MAGKVLPASEAVRLIQDRDTVVVVGSGWGVMEPSLLLEALQKRYAQTGHPRDLALVHIVGLGDRQGGGADRFALPGFVRRVIGGHWYWSVNLWKMACADQFEAYNLPQGVLSHLLRQIASGGPGVVTKVGMRTFADPRVEGGKLNKAASEDLVKVVTIEGDEYLLYKAFPVHATLIRGTTSDEQGNITFEHEGVCLDALAAAQAAKNCGGKVLVQVKRITETGTLMHPMMVKVPGILVDAVVVDENQRQTNDICFDPSLCGETRRPLETTPPMKMSERKVIARRAAMEIRPGAVINLGFGMPDGVGSVSAEEGIADLINLTIELGPIGGLPLLGRNFGIAWNPLAIVDQPSMFDFYHGGGLDITFLGFGQVDRAGNVNVSKLGGRIIGTGGFIDISQCSKKVVFCGTFTAGGMEVMVSDAGPRILREGRTRKFVQNVDQITFSGEYARERGQTVLYVTERAVFQLRPEGLTLVEIAPGIDIEQDVLAQMGFRPIVADDLKTMDMRLYRQSPMGLKNDLARAS